MARISDLFNKEPYNTDQNASAGAVQTTQMPPGAQQIVSTIDGFMPIIEQVTGLTRREIFLQMLKTGARGGNWLDVLTGLAGQKPAPEAKFIKYVKTLAIWVPVALFLLGISIVAVYAFLKLTVIMMGGL
jgi:hypothetical protein